MAAGCGVLGLSLGTEVGSISHAAMAGDVPGLSQWVGATRKGLSRWKRSGSECSEPQGIVARGRRWSAPTRLVTGARNAWERVVIPRWIGTASTRVVIQARLVWNRVVATYWFGAVKRGLDSSRWIRAESAFDG